MARQRRSIEEQISDLVTQGRTGRAHIMATPAMAPVEAAMIADNAIQNEHLVPGAVALENLDRTLQENLQALADNDAALEGAAERLAEAEGRLDSVFGSVSDLSGQVTDASGKATAAQSAAAAASSAASAAQSKADTANTAASTAQSRADAAATAAADAAGIAAGKGKVLVQGSAPGVDDRNAQTLWIDTTSGNNTPKRWVSGTTWSAVTDKAATDAASAAATAASAAATAKSAADAAQATANAAQAAAGAAQTTANSALTMAGSKSKVYYDTAGPSGTATNGDTWRQVDGSGNVIAEWRRDGAWKPQKITSEAISNLDVGKLTSGTAVINDAVVQNIAARTSQFIEADIGKLVVTGTANLSEAVARKFAANTGQFMELYASQVYVGQGGNFIYDPQFLDTALNDIRRGFSTGTWTFIKGTATTANAMQTVTANTNTEFKFFREGAPTASRKKEFIPVTTGQVYDFAVDITTNITANCRWNLHILKADGSVAYTGMTQSSGTGRRVLPYTYTVPDGVVGIYPAVACLTNGVTWTVHGNATFREKVTPSLIVDGLMNGKRIIGASIETSAAANTGVKLDNTGVTGHGEGTLTNSAGTSVPYNTRAILTQRASPFATNSNDRWPGLWFEGERKDGQGGKPKWAAGLMASTANSEGLVMRSSRTTDNTAHASVSVDTSLSQMIAVSDRANNTAPPTSQTIHNVFPEGWTTQSYRNGIGTLAEIHHDGDGVIHMDSQKGVSMTPMHAEFNASFSLASSAYEVVPAVTYTKNTSIKGYNGFATAQANSRIMLDTGVYAVTVFVDCGASMGANPAVSVRWTESSTIWATGFVSGRWNVFTSNPAVFVGTRAPLIIYVMQNSGAARTAKVRVNIEKLK